METNNPFNDTIEKLNKNTESVDKETRDEESTDKENTDPAYIIYNAISNTSIEILKNEEVVKTFKKIADAVGEDISKSMVEMFAILMTQSAYNAILFYDNMLTTALENQFNLFSENINNNRADISAHNSVLKLFKKKLGVIETMLNIDKIKSENNIKSE